MLAVDAGVHLGAIIEILEKHLPDAVHVPFHGNPLPGRWNTLPPNFHGDHGPKARSIPSFYPPVVEPRKSRLGSPKPDGRGQQLTNLVFQNGPFYKCMVPHTTARANAAYMLRNYISAFLITHPHLDHVSGFAINTAAFQHTTRPKRLVALSDTIDAIKTHIFNDVIWPNLSDEEGGAGLISYQRLSEGGHEGLGEGEGQGYLEICDGLDVLGWKVSHGHCMKRHVHRGSNSGEINPLSPVMTSDRRGSRHSVPPNDYQTQTPTPCVIDSSAYFIRDQETGHEILIFGDVEPDSISLDPRNAHVWAEAAPKIARGTLAAIFIECSYDDSQPDQVLFGHLAPRHLIAELIVLADKVYTARARLSLTADTPQRTQPPSTFTARRPSNQTHFTNSSSPASPDCDRKRKRPSPSSHPGAAADDGDESGRRTPSRRSGRALRPSRPSPSRASSATSPRTVPASGPTSVPDDNDTVMALKASEEERMKMERSDTLKPLPNNGAYFSTPDVTTNGANEGAADGEGRWREPNPLKGLKVVVIHVKDSLADGISQRDKVNAQLREQGERRGLGCEFLACFRGMSVYV